MVCIKFCFLPIDLTLTLSINMKLEVQKNFMFNEPFCNFHYEEGSVMNISEAAAKVELTPVTLRYYERIGLIPAVKRKNGGIRNYQEEDIRWIEFIKCMKSAGLSIESLVEYTSLYVQGDTTSEVRKDILIEEREVLRKKYQEIGETLAKLDKKIEFYDLPK